MRLGVYFYPRGSKINIFDIVYVLIAKSECTGCVKMNVRLGVSVNPMESKINIFANCVCYISQI